LKNSKNKLDLDVLNYNEPSNTPLQCSIMVESLEMTKMLVEKGASLDLGSQNETEKVFDKNNEIKIEKNENEKDENEKIHDFDDSKEEEDYESFIPPLFTSIFYFNHSIVSFLIDSCHNQKLDYLIQSITHILVAVGKLELLVIFLFSFFFFF
jgi:ankyrin repeat protein